MTVPTECVAPKPAGWSWAEAAALPLVGVTTYRALLTRARLRAGESLLVLGAGGGVATTAVILGHALGCHVVVTSSSDDKIARSEALGAAGGVRYDDLAWVSHARELSPGGHGFDVVLDAVGTWSDSLAALRPGGRLVVLGASRASAATIEARPFYFGQFSLLGTTMGSPADFDGLLGMVEELRIRPPVLHRSFALEEAADAHRLLETGTCFGKVTLEI